MHRLFALTRFVRFRTLSSPVTTTATVVLASLTLTSFLAPAAQAQVYLTSGTTQITGDFVSLYAGRDSQGHTSDPNTNQPYIATANIIGSIGSGSTRSYNTSTINVSSGSVYTMFNYDASTTNISGGSITNLENHNTSTTNIMGGTVAAVDNRDTSTTNISGGTVGSINSYDGGTVNIIGGKVSNATSNGGTTNISGGTVGATQSYTTGIVNISGGTFDYVYASYTSIINISGGAVTTAYVDSTGTVNISGGSVTDLFGYGNGTFNITGGTIGTNTVRLLNNSVLNLAGAGLSFSSAGSGSDGNGNYTAYMLSGILQGGQSINGVRLLDYDGGLSVGNPSAGTGNLHFIAAAVTAPEPTTFALLSLALPAIGLIRKRRHA